MNPLRLRQRLENHPVAYIIEHNLPVEYTLNTNPPATLRDAVLLYEYACKRRAEAGSESSLSPGSGWWWGARQARLDCEAVAAIMFRLAHRTDAATPK